MVDECRVRLRELCCIGPATRRKYDNDQRCARVGRFEHGILAAVGRTAECDNQLHVSHEHSNNHRDGTQLAISQRFWIRRERRCDVSNRRSHVQFHAGSCGRWRSVRTSTQLDMQWYDTMHSWTGTLHVSRIHAIARLWNVCAAERVESRVCARECVGNTVCHTDAVANTNRHADEQCVAWYMR